MIKFLIGTYYYYYYSRNPDSELTVEKLRLGGEQGSFFEHEAGVCRGVHMTFSRKWLPFLHDERDFVR